MHCYLLKVLIVYHKPDPFHVRTMLSHLCDHHAKFVGPGVELYNRQCSSKFKFLRTSTIAALLLSQNG